MSTVELYAHIGASFVLPSPIWNAPSCAWSDIWSALAVLLNPSSGVDFAHRDLEEKFEWVEFKAGRQTFHRTRGSLTWFPGYLT